MLFSFFRLLFKIIFPSTSIISPPFFSYRPSLGDVDKPNVAYASLGAHLSLIALTVFLSFGVSLTGRIIEIELNIHHRVVRTFILY